MSGALLMMMGAARPLDAASISSAWSSVNDDFGAPVGATNEDRTISWSVGGARNFSIDYAGSGGIEYRINSGSWTVYTAAFSLSSGQTLAWKYIATDNESGTAQVRDETRGANLTSGSFGYSASGW